MISLKVVIGSSYVFCLGSMSTTPCNPAMDCMLESGYKAQCSSLCKYLFLLLLCYRIVIVVHTYSCYDLTDDDTGSNSGNAEFNFLAYHRSSVLIGQSLMSDSRCDA